MSFTQTPNYSLYKPTVNADNDQWGTHLNSNADTLDTQLKNVSNAVPAASTTTPVMDSGAGGTGVATTFARGDHYHPTDTTRAPLASPAFTGTPSLPTGTTGVTQAAGTNNTTLATTAFVAPSVQAAQDSTGRNLAQNGTFVVQQRGTGPWTATGNYLADRWWAGMGSPVDTISHTIVSLVDADRTAIGDEQARFAMQNVFTGNASAGAYNLFTQGIETVRRLSGRTVTVSFWAIRTAGTATQLGVNANIYYGTGGSPSATVNTAGTAVTISTTWTRYTVQIALPTAAGKTLGTNGDDTTYIQIWYSSGTTNATNAGSIGVQSGTVRIFGVQCEIGSVATPLDAGGSPQQILAQCQRYYFAGAFSIYGYNTAAGIVTTVVPLPVTMRAVPTLTPGTPTTNSNASSPGLQTYTGNSSMLQGSVAATATGQISYVNTFNASADL